MNANQLKFLGAIAVALSGVTACGGPAEPAPFGDHAGDRAAPVAGEHDFGVVPNSSLLLEASGSWITEHGGPASIDLPVRGGGLAVTVGDDGMVLEQLALDLDDVDVGISLVTPLGGTLTDISLVLERPASAEGSQGEDYAEGVASLDLRLEWSLTLPDGGVIELGSPEIDELPCELDLSVADDGSLHLVLSVAEEGDLMTLADAIDVTSIALTLEAVEVDGGADLPEHGG